MSWENPITNWGQAGQTVPGATDFNRIEGNIDILGKYDRAPGYGTATGTNAKAITLSPAPGSYYDGLCFAFKNSVENTGAVTINVNGLGAKALKKPNGNDLPAGALKADSVYTVRYNGTNFILQGSDSSGNATAADVLAGKTFSNDVNTGLTGTMPNNPSQTATLQITGAAKPQKVVPAGYTPGGTITAELAAGLASVIKKDEVVGGVTGTYEKTYTAGNNVIFDCPWEMGIGYPTTRLSYKINNPGTYRFSIDVNHSADSGGQGVLKKNGEIICGATFPDYQYTTYAEDAQCDVGDIITAEIISPLGEPIYIKNVQIKVAEQE